MRRRAHPIRLLAIDDESLCPVFHVRRLISLLPVNGSITSVFRSTTSLDFKASATQIRQWISTVFRAAHIVATPGSIRRVLANQGFLEGQSLQQIQLRGNWRRSSTVQRHYLNQ